MTKAFVLYRELDKKTRAKPRTKKRAKTVSLRSEWFWRTFVQAVSNYRCRAVMVSQWPVWQTVSRYLPLGSRHVGRSTVNCITPGPG